VTVFNGYPVSVVLAVFLHGGILVALFYFQQANTQVIDIVRPPAVKALLVSENPQARNEQVQQQRVAQQQQEQRAAQQRAEQQRQEVARAEQQRVEEQQRSEQQQAEQQRAEQERNALQQRQELERRQAEERRVEEQQRQREEQQRREQEQQRQQELAAQQERERQEQAVRAQQDADARELAETEAEIVMAYSAIIHDLVQQNWSRPPSARNGMVAVLRIRMVPTGDVVEVEVVRSSGDFAFDRAAESAVMRVNRFTELQGMPSRLFDRNFRTFLLTFRPQDLLN
jgi:colicin import membrane protein